MTCSPLERAEIEAAAHRAFLHECLPFKFLVRSAGDKSYVMTPAMREAIEDCKDWIEQRVVKCEQTD